MKLMNAQEAANLAIESNPVIRDVLSKIQERAKGGNRTLVIDTTVSSSMNSNVVKGLKDLGYEVTFPNIRDAVILW